MKKSCLNKKGYFFLIDAVLALGVLAIGGFLIFSLYFQTPPESGPTILSEDIMEFFANTQIKNLNNPYAGLGGLLWSTEGSSSGLCPGEQFTADGETSLLQQVGIFYKKSQGAGGNSCYFNQNDNNPNIPEDLIEKFIGTLTEDTLPPQYSFEFWLYDLGDPNDPNDDLRQLLYPAIEQSQLKNSARVLMPSKRMVYGVLDPQTGEMFGPYTAEVIVW